MKLLAAPLIALNSVTSLANPIDKVREKIESTYSPEITYEKLNSSWSLYGCRVDEIQIRGKDPVNFLDREVDISFYQSKKKNMRSAVIILPPTGGVNLLDRGYANELCSSGVTTVIVSGWKHQGETSLDYEMHNNGALRTLAASRHVFEFLVSSGYESVGILGTSIGAVGASLVLGFEPRIKAAALIAGSAHFRDIIVNSDESGVSELREARWKAYGYKSEQDYAKAVRENVWIEPLDFLNPREQLKSLIISADNDKTVLSEYQFALAERLKATRHIRRQGSHRQVIQDTFRYNRDDVTRFFLESLEPNDKKGR